jgi:hypothetical protein
MPPYPLRFACLATVVLLASCTTAAPGTALRIETAEFRLELSWSCAGYGLPPVSIERQGNELRFTSVPGGEDVPLIWPNGFAARLVAGAGTLYASDGSVVGREGDELGDLGICETRGGVPVVASVGPKSYR